MALSNALGQLFRISGQNARVAGSQQVAALSNAVTKFELPDMPYDYGALEPHISGEIMELHHDRHHRTYVNNLNAALDQYESAEKQGDLQKMIELQNAIKFNGGGHINHSIFWQNLSPNGGGEPKGELATRINQQWGSFEKFKEEFNTKSTSVQGSGWCWLGFNKQKDRLEIAQCQNQDPLAMHGLIPLLGFDMWEHAFYLQFRNKKAEYVQHLWNVINFDDVEQRLQNAKA